MTIRVWQTGDRVTYWAGGCVDRLQEQMIVPLLLLFVCISVITIIIGLYELTLMMMIVTGTRVSKQPC